MKQQYEITVRVVLIVEADSPENAKDKAVIEISNRTSNYGNTRPLPTGMTAVAVESNRSYKKIRA